MANELGAVASWTFHRQVEIPRSIYEMLVPGEVAQVAFKTVRDVAVFTNKRLIVRDTQGITGKKVEQYSVPWDSVNMWSSENAGHIDIDSEIELWTRAGHIKIELKRGADIRAIDNLIASHVLGGGQDAPAQQRAPQPAPAPQQEQQPSMAQQGAQQIGNMFGGMFKR